MIQEGKRRKNEVVILIIITIIIIIIITIIIIIMISITVIKKHPYFSHNILTSKTTFTPQVEHACLRHSIRYAYAFINILPD